MIERLVVNPVWHEHDRAGALGYITTVFMTVVDKQLYFQFADQLGLIVLSEIDRRLSDAMLLEPVASYFMNAVALALISVGHKDQSLLPAEIIQKLPLFRGRSRRQLPPEFWVVGD